MKKTFAAAGLVATALSSPAVGMGHFYTTPELFDNCKGGNLDQIKCMSYIAGVLDASVMLRQKGSEIEVCLPKGTTLRQLQQIFINYAEDNPKIWNWPAHLLVQTAVIDSFACSPLPK